MKKGCPRGNFQWEIFSLLDREEVYQREKALDLFNQVVLKLTRRKQSLQKPLEFKTALRIAQLHSKKKEAVKKSTKN